MFPLATCFSNISPVYGIIMPLQALSVKFFSKTVHIQAQIIIYSLKWKSYKFKRLMVKIVHRQNMKNSVI